MKALKNFLWAMLSESGDISSKRCIATSGMATLIYLSIYSIHSGKPIDAGVFAMLLTAVLGAAGITAYEKKWIKLPSVKAKDAAAASALIILIMVTGIGCRSIKETKQVTTNTVAAKTDTLRVIVKQRDTIYRYVAVKDTAIGIASRVISLTEVANAKNDTTVTNGNVSLHIYSLPDGRRKADCKADSLTVVIEKLTKERDYYRHEADSSYVAVVKDFYSKDSTTVESKVVEVKPVYFRWWFWVIVFLLGVGWVFFKVTV